MSTSQIKPEGYKSDQRLDEIRAINSDILRDLEAIIGTNVNEKETYRLVVKAIANTYKSNAVIAEIKQFYKTQRKKRNVRPNSNPSN